MPDSCLDIELVDHRSYFFALFEVQDFVIFRCLHLSYPLPSLEVSYDLSLEDGALIKRVHGPLRMVTDSRVASDPRHVEPSDLILPRELRWLQHGEGLGPGLDLDVGSFGRLIDRVNLRGLGSLSRLLCLLLLGRLGCVRAQVYVAWQATS